MKFRNRLGLLAAAAVFSVLPTVAPAITILDSAWEANGGTDGDKAAGFAASEALAQEEPFRAAVDLIVAGGGGSGVWIGRDEEGDNYILTAAHVVWHSDGKGGGRPMTPDEVGLIAGNRTIYDAKAVHVHPKYFRGIKYDLAIVVTGSEPSDKNEEGDGEPIAFTDLVKEPPRLFCQTPMGDEGGLLATIVGFGKRGTGTVGSEDESYEAEELAAAHNIIDGVTGEENEDDPRQRDMIVYDFDSEDGGSNTLGDKFGSEAKPVDKLEGAGAQGDSGGPVFIRTEEDGVLLAGVTSLGDSEKSKEISGYGSVHYVARTAASIEWIEHIFPGVGRTGLSATDCDEFPADPGVLAYKPDWEKGSGTSGANDAGDDDPDDNAE